MIVLKFGYFYDSLKKGRVVVILQGKYAGCKGVIIENHEATKKHPFGHAVIAGVSRYLIIQFIFVFVHCF